LRRNFHNSQRRDASALNLSDEWNEGWLNCVFEIAWQAYDELAKYYKKRAKGKKATDESEDEITTAFLRFMNISKSYSPAKFRLLDFVNQPPDKSKPRNRKANTNDIGVFFGNEIEKPKFIFESKKIDTVTKSGIKSYKEDLDIFLEEKYGSHLSESGLIAYLLVKTTKEMFEVIEKSFNKTLTSFNNLGKTKRPHKTSKHKRKSKSALRKDFLCHHLVFEIK